MPDGGGLLVKRRDYTDTPVLSSFQRGAGSGCYCMNDGKHVQIKKAVAESVRVRDVNVDINGRSQIISAERWVRREEIYPTPRREKQNDEQGDT